MAEKKANRYISFNGWGDDNVEDRWRKELESFDFHRFLAEYDFHKRALKINIEDMSLNVYGAYVSREYFVDLSPNQIRQFLERMLDGKYGSMMRDE